MKIYSKSNHTKDLNAKSNNQISNKNSSNYKNEANQGISKIGMIASVNFL
jgi:hypothetical protein